MSQPDRLTIALAKGKLFAPAVNLLQHAGIIRDAGLFDSRRLLCAADLQPQFEFVLLKNSDVPTYVEYGIAHAGITGWDVLKESGAEVYSPLNLGFGRCRIVVAGRPADAARGYVLSAQLRVATKYPRLARDHFDRRGVQVEMIRLTGSVELAVVVGLADRIVDLVETGETLRQNGLAVHEVIAESSARLIVNRASHQTKRVLIQDLLERLRKATRAHSAV